MSLDNSSVEKRSLGEVFFLHYVNVAIYRRRVGEPEDYSRERGRILAVLKRQQPCSLKRLCNILGISNSTCSVLVDKLVKSGIVSRIQDESDRRKVILTLTDEGEKSADEDYMLQCQRLDKVFSGLSDIERDTLYAALMKVDELLKQVPLRPENY